MSTVYEIEQNLTNKQKELLDSYRQEHHCKEFKEGSGGFGSTSKIAFIVGSTVIGPTLKIYCPYCKSIQDITDIALW